MGSAPTLRTTPMSSPTRPRRFGAGFRVVSVAIDAQANLEARARDARYDALERVRAELDAVAIFVGHTRDDQAETVLLNVLRGSGASGIAGMPLRRGFIRRPLLATRRCDDARTVCASRARAGVRPDERRPPPPPRVAAA